MNSKVVKRISKLFRKFNSYIKSNEVRTLIKKQAMFKAVKKVNPAVFLSLIHKFTELFYQSDLVKTYKGYVLLAEDGTCNELRPTEKSLASFGCILNQFITNESNVRKATSRSAALYDITNGLIVDFSMNP